MDNITNLTFQECMQIQLLINKLDNGATAKSIRNRLSLLVGTKISAYAIADISGVNVNTIIKFENASVGTSITKIVAIKKAYQSILNEFKTKNNIVIDSTFVLSAKILLEEVEPVFA